MIALQAQVRTALLQDQQSIANLMFFEPHVHRHLDWRAPLEWLGDPAYWLLERDGHLLAALACPQDPAGMAWIRLFSHATGLEASEAFDALWTAAREALPGMGARQAAAIALHDWLVPPLRAAGFTRRQDILMLEWRGRTLPALAVLPAGVRIDALTRDDLPAVAALDATAFDPLWQNSQAALERALPQAMLATVARGPQGLLGYQISTRSQIGAHLARLAVDPSAQRQGIGRALVTDLMRQAMHHGILTLTVNTQSDNPASLSLYRSVGFERTGEEYPVYVYALAGR